MTTAVVIQTVAPIEPCCWVAVWGVLWERKSYFENPTLATAYAIAHRGPNGEPGRVVRMAALDPWPVVADERS